MKAGSSVFPCGGRTSISRKLLAPLLEMLPECQLRGKFLTSHHTNKQCTPLTLIKGRVSADRASGGGRDKGRRYEVRKRWRKGRAREKEKRRFAALNKMLLALLLCPRPWTLRSTYNLGSGLSSAPLKVNLNRQGSVWQLLGFRRCNCSRPIKGRSIQTKWGQQR